MVKALFSSPFRHGSLDGASFGADRHDFLIHFLPYSWHSEEPEKT